MLLRELIWDIFMSTGDIGIYLLYRRCLDSSPSPAARTSQQEG